MSNKNQKSFDLARRAISQMKYVIGLVKLWEETISSCEVPLEDPKGKLKLFNYYLRMLYRITSEYHWVETGVIQRPFDRITDSIESDDRGCAPISVYSIQGFNKYLTKKVNKPFADKYCESPELSEFDDLSDAVFKELGGKLFSLEGLLKNLFVKFWGKKYTDFGCFEWSTNGYRMVILTVEIVQMGEDFQTYRPEKDYNHFTKTKEVFFGRFHQAGLNYAAHGSIHAPQIFSKVRLFSLIIISHYLLIIP
jgi:hypothetical protein